MELVTELCPSGRELKRSLCFLCLTMLKKNHRTKKKKTPPKPPQKVLSLYNWNVQQIIATHKLQLQMLSERRVGGICCAPLPKTCIFFFKHFDCMQMKRNKIESFNTSKVENNTIYQCVKIT